MKDGLLLSVRGNVGAVESAMRQRDTEVLDAMQSLRAAADDVSDAVGDLLTQAAPRASHAPVESLELAPARAAKDARNTRPASLARELRDIAIQMRFIESAVGRWLARNAKKSRTRSGTLAVARPAVGSELPEHRGAADADLDVVHPDRSGCAASASQLA